MQNEMGKVEEMQSQIDDLRNNHCAAEERLTIKENMLAEQKQLSGKLQETLDTLHTGHLDEIERYCWVS